MRSSPFAAVALLLLAGCALVTEPSGGTRPLPSTLSTIAAAAHAGGARFAAASDSITATGIVPPVCGSQSVNAKLVRGTVVATIILAPNPLMGCAFSANFIIDRVVIQRVPSGSREVTLAYEYAGRPDTRVSLGWSIVRLP